jgi:hypothetical protein
MSDEVATPTIVKAAAPGVAAHIQHTTIHIEQYVPYHPQRTDDPYYHLFNQARDRLNRMGLLKCQVCGTDQQIELHHNEIEFSMAAGVDIAKFEALHPDLNIKDDATFQQFVESDHNLTPLCRKHHIGVQGIHVLPYPFWKLLAVWKDDKGPAVVTPGA